MTDCELLTCIYKAAMKMRSLQTNFQTASLSDMKKAEKEFDKLLNTIKNDRATNNRFQHWEQNKQGKAIWPE